MKVKIDIEEDLIRLLGDPWGHDYSGPEYTEFGHTGSKKLPVQPPQPEAATFADALLKLVVSKIRLEHARSQGNDYRHFDVGNELNQYNRAADAVWNLVRGT